MNSTLITELKSLGCKTDRQAQICAQIYIELTEVKKYWDVNCFYNTSLEILYITARKSKASTVSTFIPISVTDSLKFTQMQKYAELSENESVYLAMLDADSTSVYYQIQNGIGEPPKSVPVKLSRGGDKRQQLDVTLKRHCKVLEESALCGIPVTISSHVTGRSNPVKCDRDEDSEYSD